MKRFRFRLERVLQYRNTVKDERMKELILKNNEVHEVESYIKLLGDQQLQNGPTQDSVMTQEELSLFGMYGKRLRAEMAQAEEALVHLKQEAEVALVAYQEAATEAEALEKLKEKKRDEYVAHYEQEELKTLDELAVMQQSKDGAKL